MANEKLNLAPSGARTCHFVALTDVWTGDAETAKTKTAARLIPTGLLGSIRWWFEVLVRGIGGAPCDPTDSHCQGREHCVVCELFGCTGWARKFRFDVLDKVGQVQRTQLRKGSNFSLRFMALRHVSDEEWTLLDATLRLIAEYGAFGGKTVLKPTDEEHRQSAAHHQDYGLVRLTRLEPAPFTLSLESLQIYARRFRVNGVVGQTWASLEHFWSVPGRYLARGDALESTFNRVLGRGEPKTCRDCERIHNPPSKCPTTSKHPRRQSDSLISPTDAVGRWLAGGQSESKKVFCFRLPPRTFGFVKPGLLTHAQMLGLLQQGWPSLADGDVLRQLQLLPLLFAAGQTSEEYR